MVVMAIYFQLSVFSGHGVSLHFIGVIRLHGFGMVVRDQI